MTMNQPCRICKAVVTVEVDDDYATIGDVYKLLPSLVCNRCADLHDENRKLIDAIRASVIRIDTASTKVREQIIQRETQTLTLLAQRYARWWKESCRGSTFISAAAIVPAIVNSPENWSAALRDYRNDALEAWRGQPKQRELKES